MIQKSIQLNKCNIFYTLKVNKHSKYIRLAINHEGRVVVTTPRYVPQFIINNFLIQKSDWILNKIEYFLHFKGVLPKSKKETKKDYLEYKDRALQIAQERLEYFNTLYNYKWSKITIKNQKTRWGSCSKKGNLNFNYKIVLLPEKARDYIIVHELCHLGEFNHSRNFWNLVAKTLPDYLEIRRNLRKIGYTLG